MRILLKPRVALKTYLPDSEREIEEAARVCWQSWDRSNGSIEDARAFIGRLKKVGHIDTMEESFLSFWMECSRAASHQVVRKRTAHFLQASQRYIKHDEPEFLIPPSISDRMLVNTYTEMMERYWDDYRLLREAGIRAEDARYVLPNATLTKLKMSANYVNWKAFFRDRCDQSAQWEIRMMANSMLEIAYEIAPSIFIDQYEEFIINPGLEGKEVIMADRVARSEFDNFLNWTEYEDGLDG
jgi:thymidylate synthase (FAD)